MFMKENPDKKTIHSTSRTSVFYCYQRHIAQNKHSRKQNKIVVFKTSFILAALFILSYREFFDLNIPSRFSKDINTKFHCALGLV